MITIQRYSEVKQVVKPWGWEKLLQPGSETYPFVMKQLLLKSGCRTSLQVHQEKRESIIILDGSGFLLHSPMFFDCARYLQGGYSVDELDRLMLSLRSEPVFTGMVFHTPPGSIHRMIADTDLMYIESSTTELDDVIRLQDDQNRTHGRIDSEHK